MSAIRRCFRRRAAARLGGLLARARARSPGVVPPQMPSGRLVSVAKSRHGRLTGQRAQTRRARAVWAAEAPLAETGKNRSGSADTQAPAASQGQPLLPAPSVALPGPSVALPRPSVADPASVRGPHGAAHGQRWG
jgi:hypothetical protein